MRGLDYGVEIAVGCRVADLAKPRLGTVMAFKASPVHDGAEFSESWRPRRALVLWDSEKPMRSGFHENAPYSHLPLSYLAPEYAARIPAAWVAPMGLKSAEQRLIGVRPGKESLAVLRLHRGEWLVMNRRDRGFGEWAEPIPHLGHLPAAFGLLAMVDDGRVVCRQDEHGLFWPLVGSPYLETPG